MFISSYARDNRFSEDVSESAVPWFAATFSYDRVPQETIDKILVAIPHRLMYFNSHCCAMIACANGNVDGPCPDKVIGLSLIHI